MKEVAGISGECIEWATTADYLGSLNDLPGGGSLGVIYGLDANFARIGGLNFDPGTGVSIDKQLDSWAVTWNGWQYLLVENESTAVDPRNGRQDLQGLGIFAQIGLADKNTNPIHWSVTAGLSGRGSIPGRDADTRGVGSFYNKLQDLNLGSRVLVDSVNGLEVYYDIALLGSASLTLDAQWTQNAFQWADDATILGARLNVSF